MKSLLRSLRCDFQSFQDWILNPLDRKKMDVHGFDDQSTEGKVLVDRRLSKEEGVHQSPVVFLKCVPLYEHCKSSHLYFTK